MTEDGFAGVESVFGLLYIVGMWVVIYIVCNLVDAGQRVEYPHILLGVFEHVAVKDVDILDLLVFHQIGKTLLLYARHI